MKNFDKVMVVLRRFFRKTGKFISDYCIQIVLILAFISCILNVIAGNSELYVKITLVICYVLFCILILIQISVKKLELQMSLKIPLYGKRFTSKEENGEIYIKKEDLQEALLYLYEIEEFIKNNSLEG